MDTKRKRVRFTPRWTVNRDDRKSSAALLPVGGGPPLVVAGYGIGTTQGTGNYGLCDPPTGGVITVRRDGQVAWRNEFTNEGNVHQRASPVPPGHGRGPGPWTPWPLDSGVGCFGKLYAYGGATGREEWGVQVGPRLIASPSVGDLDGDGALEIVIASYDRKVYALGGS